VVKSYMSHTRSHTLCSKMVYRAAVLLTHLNVLVREDSDDLIRAVAIPYALPSERATCAVT
jgi:hypothetical protein